MRVGVKLRVKQEGCRLVNRARRGTNLHDLEPQLLHARSSRRVPRGAAAQVNGGFLRRVHGTELVRLAARPVHNASMHRVSHKYLTTPVSKLRTRFCKRPLQVGHDAHPCRQSYWAIHSDGKLGTQPPQRCQDARQDTRASAQIDHASPCGSAGHSARHTTMEERRAGVAPRALLCCRG